MGRHTVRNRQEEHATQTETNRQEEQERQTEQEEYDSSTKILPKDIRSSETTILRKERQFEKGIKASNEHSKLREAVNKIKFIPGTSSVALYRKFREHTDINAIIQNSNQYLAKTIDTLQEGFHWSEMYETMPGGSAAQNSKTLKPEAEMIKIGVMSKKA